MKKFSDGFSDSSYDDLLNEYAGNALGNTPSKAEPQKKVERKTPTTKAKPMETPKFNIDISKKKTINEKDFGFIQSFEEENSLKKSDTMEFSKQPRRSQPVIEKRNDARKPDFNSRLNSMKASAQRRIYSDETSPESQQPKKKKRQGFFQCFAC